MLKNKLLKLVLLLAILIPSGVFAIQYWGKNIDSLQYLMPTESFAVMPGSPTTTIYVGLENFGVDQLEYNTQKLTRTKSFRFEKIIDSSVGIHTLLYYKDFLIVGGIQDGFLALDPTKDYPSESTQRYELLFKPNNDIIVWSSLLKVMPWKDYLLMLTADQLIVAQMTSPTDFAIKASVAVAPDLTNWKDYWATDMALLNDKLYISVAHELNPVLRHVTLSETFSDIVSGTLLLPEKKFYLQSIEVIDNRLFVSQNKTLVEYEIIEADTPTFKVIHDFSYYISKIFKLPQGMGLSFYNNGMTFYETSDFNGEELILFPPRTSDHVEFNNGLLFVSSRKEGFGVFQKFSDFIR